MDADTIIVQETTERPGHDTRRSWRVMRKVIVWLCSGAAAIFGLLATYPGFETGDSEAKIAEFESSLRNYLNAADAAGYSQLSGLDRDTAIVLLGKNQFGV